MIKQAKTKNKTYKIFILLVFLLKVPNLMATGPLDGFFAELLRLQNKHDSVISIVHIGDSHVQCGYLSGELMRSFHKDFGNAGRGFIAPLKLAKTNEPSDYFIKSAQPDWLSSSCVKRNNQFPFGLGAMSISSEAKKINIDVIIAPKNGVGYAFNQAVLYRHENSLPLIATNILDESLAVKQDSFPDISMSTDTFQMKELVDTLVLRSYTKKNNPNNIYYGLNLTNGNPGILYHSIGINGAMYVNYTNENYIKQLSQLKPSILIISLGTNETFGRRFTEGEFKQQIKEFLSLVNQKLPNATILLTTPPACFKRTTVNKQRVYVRNNNTKKAAHAIKSLAAQENIACIDLFALMGGDDAATKWHKDKLMARDRIHFTQEGYLAQGNLIYQALMQAFRVYQTEQNKTEYSQIDSIQ